MRAVVCHHNANRSRCNSPALCEARKLPLAQRPGKRDNVGETARSMAHEAAITRSRIHDSRPLFWQRFRPPLHRLGPHPHRRPRPQLAKKAGARAGIAAATTDADLGSPANLLWQLLDPVRRSHTPALERRQLLGAVDSAARPVLIRPPFQAKCFHQMPVHSGTITVSPSRLESVSSSPKKNRINSSASPGEAK